MISSSALDFNLIQGIAAFAIFVFGFVALFGSLMVFLSLAKGLYASAKAVGAYAVKHGSTNGSNLTDFEIQADQQKRLVIPSWKRKPTEATSGNS